MKIIFDLFFEAHFLTNWSTTDTKSKQCPNVKKNVVVDAAILEALKLEKA